MISLALAASACQNWITVPETDVFHEVVKTGPIVSYQVTRIVYGALIVNTSHHDAADVLLQDKLDRKSIRFRF